MPQESSKSLLDRVLSLVAEVRPGEGFTALLLTFDVFLLLTSYYIIKPVRDALILATEGGAEFKAYASGASAVILLVAVPLYGRLVDRMARNRLIIGVTVFFIACMVGFYVLGSMEGARPSLGVPFYLWTAVYSMMIVAQFWGFANDLYTEEQGKRLFAIVGLGASAGAVAGAQVTSLLLEPPLGFLPRLDVYSLLLVSALLLGITALLTQWAHAREGGARVERRESAASDEPPPPKRDAFALVFNNRYIFLLACFSLLFTFVNTNGEYILSKLVVIYYDELPEPEMERAIGSFFGDFYTYVNILGLLLQTFAVSRIVKYGGLRVAFFIFPTVVLFSSLLIVIVPLLAVLRVTKTVENATDYSLNNTVRNMLWLPTTAEMKYKAKQAVDTFMVRMGDVSSAGLVFLGTAGMQFLGWSELPVRGFAAVNFGLCLIWLFLAHAIVRQNRRLSEQQAAGEA